MHPAINAAFYGRLRAVQRLIDRGVNLHAQDQNGYTALHAAVQEGECAVAALLLKSGADVHARDRYGNTPILRTGLQTPPEIFQLLLRWTGLFAQRKHSVMAKFDVTQKAALKDCLYHTYIHDAVMQSMKHDEEKGELSISLYNPCWHQAKTELPLRACS